VQVLETKHKSVHHSPKLVLRCPLVKVGVTNQWQFVNSQPLISHSLFRAHLSQQTSVSTQHHTHKKHTHSNITKNQ